ncbi:MAG TPA: hypothetical protein VEF72_04415 [Mycobacterium sp.]|nr:hypothetical protein [Mycobacterium sp.]
MAQQEVVRSKPEAASVFDVEVTTRGQRPGVADYARGMRKAARAPAGDGGLGAGGGVCPSA